MIQSKEVISVAVIKNGTKYAVKVVYKTEYDTEGDFPALSNFSQTFSNVKETATAAELKDFADALMGLTVYDGAPYQVSLIDTSRLVVA